MRFLFRISASAARGFLMNNEAYASQYIDHYIAGHARCGPVVMSRQN